jgi:putative PIN family toxin of toxin-antitoxin system
MSKSKKLNIVLDANWYISACISRKSRRTLYYEILKNPRFQVFYSPELMAEFDRVIARPKFTKAISVKYVSYFKAVALAYLRETKTNVAPTVVRDVDDNYLLGICDSCKADFLITGDLDLLILGRYQNTAILTMGQFLQIIAPRGNS